LARRILILLAHPVLETATGVNHLAPHVSGVDDV